ncbi:MAG TPA: hypothetical protein VJR87_11945 [Allosphingosinicella sp.]|nr:hypothetical protein [Allosphingosinicella sp.]
MTEIRGVSRFLLYTLGAFTLAGAAAIGQPGAGPARPQQPNGAAVPAPQARKPLVSLARLEPGQWQIRELGNERAVPQSICLGDPEMLVQLEHRQIACSRYIIANDAQGATVHYTCPAKDYGRTTVRVETARLAKIDTQGLVGNIPFAYRAEARRIGPCERSTAAAR